MNTKTLKLLRQHKDEIKRINRQRQLWLWASSIVFTGIIFLIFAWDWIDDLQSKRIWWLIVSTMLIISVNWWYWTMRVIRIILTHQKLEYDLIRSILYDISMVKSDLKKFGQENIDIFK